VSVGGFHHTFTAFTRATRAAIVGRATVAHLHFEELVMRRTSSAARTAQDYRSALAARSRPMIAAGLFLAVVFGLTSAPQAARRAPGRFVPPSITDIVDQQIGVNGSTGALAFTIGDAETLAGDLVVTATSSNQTLIPDANLVLGGGGDSRTVTAAPASNQTGTATITVTVTDGDTEVASDTFVLTVVVPDVEFNIGVAFETDSGTTEAEFTVLLNGGVAMRNGTVTVNYATRQGPAGGFCSCGVAISGVDFTPASGTLTFLPGETEKTITISIAGDVSIEYVETFLMALTSPVNAAIAGFAELPGFIVDNDETLTRSAELVGWATYAGVNSWPGTVEKYDVDSWNAGAASVKSLLRGDGSVEFTANSTSHYLEIGLSHGNAGTAFEEIDFGIELLPGGRMIVVENGTVHGPSRPYAVNDRLTVAVENGKVVYKRNAVTFYTSTVAAVYPLLIDVSVFSSGAVVGDVILSGWLPQDVFWTNLQGTDTFGSSTVEKWEVDGWNSGAASTRALVAGDGFVEFTAFETNTTRMLGFSRDNSGPDFSDIDFGLYLHSNATVYIVEGGITRGVFGTYAEGDRLQVAVESGQVLYRRNGVLLYTSSVVPVYPLLVDAALYTEDATLMDVTIVGNLGTNLTYTDLVNAEDCGCGSIGKVLPDSVDGWDSGGVSTQSLLSGDGFFEFIVDNDFSHRMAGLSNGNTNTDFSDIDFGVLLASNATFYVFEGGVSRGVFGNYSEGDRFRVSVTAGVVNYYRNGAIFYTSSLSPTYPLIVDVALYSPDSIIIDGMLAGDLGEEVTWTANVGATASPNALVKTAAEGWNAGAISTRALVSGDGFVTFSASDEMDYKMLGLSHGNSGNGFEDIDYGILLSGNGTYYVFESGTSRGLFGTFTWSDQFSVAVIGGVAKYLKNGAVFYTSAVAPAYPLLVDTALFSEESGFVDVMLGGNLGEAVTWTNVTGASAVGSMLWKPTTGVGWNSGATSTRAIASGDGFVSFATTEATTHKAIGLSVGSASTAFEEIDFAILLASNGTYYVLENGTSRGVFGGYAAGDRFQVAVDGGVVRYSRNGAVFYNSLVAPSYPLLVDTALYTNRASLNDVVLGCVTAVCQ
jgi:hypothetical protein